MRLIDANALIAEMNHVILEDGEDRRVFYEVIERQPTIDPVRRGKWIKLDTDTERYDEIECPFCRKRFTVDAERFCDIGFVASDLVYCPNCGAKMEEE